MKPRAEIIVLPVIRIERGGVEFVPGLPVDRTNTVDLNAFRYARERRAVERREMSSLLVEEACPMVFCGPDGKPIVFEDAQ